MYLSKFKSVALLSAAGILASSANAIPSLSSSGSFGGSDYRVYGESGISWTEANSFASGLGAGWDLVSITSLGESNFVKSLLPAVPTYRDHYWIGLSDPTGTGAYSWNDGSAFGGFTDWLGGEPNALPTGNPDYGALDYRSGWGWNNLPNDTWPQYQKGFVVERVPDGGITLILLGLGLGGLAILRRKLA